MSIDFDSAALQTQHDEEEYDQEDYAREQELHKLLTDLPDDMLEDSRDSSSPELEYSTCSNKNTGNSPQSGGPQLWSNHVRPTSHEQNHETNYNQYPYEDQVANGHMNGCQPHPNTWNQPQSPQFNDGDYTYNSMGTENNDFSADTFGTNTYPQGTKAPVVFNGDGGYEDRPVHGNTRNHFQMFNSQPHQGPQMDPLQREFLDSTAHSADQEQLAQLRILHKAQQRQIEDLEQKLEDSRRNMRYLEHQFVIVKDEKDGLAVSLKESSRLIEEHKEREVKMQKTVKALEHQVQLLTDKDQENVKKQRIADAAVDSMKQQMLEMCRSDTLARTREQHDRDITVMREQHETALLASQQKIDSVSQALNEQVDHTQRLREQVKQLERQREEDQLERARVINGLTQRLEESQQQCAKLLHTSSVQEMNQLQIKLKQAQSAKALSENMNKALQEDLTELKKHITLFESAVKHNVISLDQSNDLENHLSESCIDLGLKKVNLKNGTLHSPLAILPDSKLPKEDALRLLRAEMQRCLGNLKGKRQKIEQLQEELRLCQTRVDELQTQLEETKLTCQIRDNGQEKQIDVSGASQKEFQQLKEDKQHLQEQVEALEKKYKELKQSEEKVKAANLELCTKMREMIQELDQEKQEAAERAERIHQLHRDDVVNRIRTELAQEHSAQIQQLTEQHQQQLQELQAQLSEAQDKMSAVQECYISVCKEKDSLEERIRNQDPEEVLHITKQKIQEETNAALKKLRAEMEAEHQASVSDLTAAWTKEKEKVIQQKVDSKVAQINATWKEEMKKMEQTWSQKIEEAKKRRHPDTAGVSCQTDELQSKNVTISFEELESRLKEQKQQLRLEADRARLKAMEEAKKHIQKELQEKHLEDMSQQVEGAITRAYHRWIEDLASLPEYQTSLQTEREKWEQEQQIVTEQKISLALRAAEEQWLERQESQPKEKSFQCEAELQQTVSTLQSRLEQTRKEQTALLKAELSAARAAWNRDKQQEINNIQARSEQAFQTKLQEQHTELEQALRQAREELELEKRGLLSQTEAKLQQAMSAREEELKCHFAEKERTLTKEIKDEIQAEIQDALGHVQTEVFMLQRGLEEANRTIGGPSENTITQVIHNFCKDIVNRAVSQAKREWKRMSEEKLSLVLKETQEQYEKEITKMQALASQRVEQGRCRKECTENVSKLQKKNHELQKHLEKACRQLQNAVKEHNSAVKKLKEEHEISLQTIREEHMQHFQETKTAKEKSGSAEQQHFQKSLEEMKQQYLHTVEKIRGDMMRYLQESRERAAEMIRVEVQRERQDTARKMRHYYLTCLQELLEDGGKGSGAEKKIMNAASKLAAMAKVLETPVKSKSGNNYALLSGGTTLPKSTAPLVKRPDFDQSPSDEHQHKRLNQRVQGENLCNVTQNPISGVKTKSVSHQTQPISGTNQDTSGSHRTFRQKPSLCHFNDGSVRSKNRNLYLHGHVLDKQTFPQEPPVREERATDFSSSSNDSDTGPQIPRLSLSGRKVEPVKPFSVSATSNCDFGEFAELSPNASDLTVYNEICKKPNADLYSRKTNLLRQPTPGSESSEQYDACPKPLFSELRQKQQDSGFGSPFYQEK